MSDRDIDLAILNAAQVLIVGDDGRGPRRGAEQGRLETIDNASVVIHGDRIVEVGPTPHILRQYELGDAQVIDATGQLVMPGLIDPHTHPLFAGDHSEQYGQRLAGATLEEIPSFISHPAGVVALTRAAGDDELLDSTRKAFGDMLRSGTTTVEAKSGYGLSLDHELRQLQLLGQLADEEPLNVIPTFLGAHGVPTEYQDDPAAYVTLIIEEMLPAVAAQGIARFCDVTCEPGFFTPEQCRQMLAAAAKWNLPGRVHADGWGNGGGWRAAVAAGAVCADHLTYTPDSEIEQVGATETIAVLLPAAELVYFTERRANARKLIETGVPVALATDFCSHIYVTSLYHALGLGTAWFRLTPEEAIVATTVNAAYAVGLGAEAGILEPGRRADLLVIDVPHYRMLLHDMGVNRVRAVVVGGRLAASPTPG